VCVECGDLSRRVAGLSSSSVRWISHPLIINPLNQPPAEHLQL